MGKRERGCGITGETGYAKLARQVADNNRDLHVVSIVHALIVIFLAGRCLSIPSLDENRAFGWDEDAGFVFAIATG